MRTRPSRHHISNTNVNYLVTAYNYNLMLMYKVALYRLHVKKNVSLSSVKCKDYIINLIPLRDQYWRFNQYFIIYWQLNQCVNKLRFDMLNFNRLILVNHYQNFLWSFSSHFEVNFKVGLIRLKWMHVLFSNVFMINWTLNSRFWGYAPCKNDIF